MWQELFPTPPVSKSIPTGTRLLVRDAVPTDAIRLCRGRVAAGQFEEGELRHRLVAVEGPCWLDIGSVLFEKPCAADWVAETPVEVEFVAGDALRQWLAAQPATVCNLMRDSSELQRQQTESTLTMMVKDADARCAQWLLRRAETSTRGAMAVPLKEPKRAMAAQLGVAPATLSRILRRLREMGLISESGSVVKLVDPTGLRAIAAR